MNWINHFEPHILERGWEYYRSGAVEHLVKAENKVEAVVRGSEYYKVKIVYHRDEIKETYCSCPYAAKGYPCKHMAAVLYAADNRGEDLSIIITRRPLKRILPPTWKGKRSA